MGHITQKDLVEKAVLITRGDWPIKATDLLYTKEGGFAFATLDGIYYRVSDCCILDPDKWIHLCKKEEFNATADRVRNKPDWKDAPAWAQWLAQNDAGVWWWYPSGDVPMIYGGCFANNSMKERAVRAAQGEVIGGWRNTLEQRPVEASSNTIANLLDKFAASLSVNDWWDYENDKPAYDGALPPVGVKVLLWHKGFKQGVAELVSIKGLELAWWNVDGQRFQHDRADLYGFRPLDHDQNRKACAEFGLRMANAKNEIDAAAKLCGKNKILADAVFAIGEQIKSVKKDAE